MTIEETFKNKGFCWKYLQWFSFCLFWSLLPLDTFKVILHAYMVLNNVLVVHGYFAK